MKKLFAIAVPILPGKTEHFKKFTDALRTTRNEEFVQSRNQLNVHERTFLQHTPMGDMIVVTLEGENPQAAFTNFAQANNEFTKWFTKEVKEIHGIDLTNPPAGSLPELIVDSKQGVLQSV